MYVITHHHDYDEVLLGPIDWKPSFIASVIQQDLDLDFKPDVKPSDAERVPYNIFPNVRIRKAEVVYEEINPKIQRHDGPFWTYTEEVGTATYTAVNKSVEQVKGELKQVVATERYKKETSGFKYTLGDLEVYISTDRDARKVYTEKLVVIGDDPIQFKFDKEFITLTKAELQGICTAIEAHVQGSFNWEVQKQLGIDACSTLEELDAFVIVEEENVNA